MIQVVAVWSVVAMLAAAAALALVIAWHRAEHRFVAAALVATLLAELGRAALVAWALPPPGPEPLVGLAMRLAGAADDGLFIVWPATVAATSLRVLARRGRWTTVLVAVAWLGATAAIAATYDASAPAEARAELLRQKYLAADLVASLVAAASLVDHARRTLAMKPPQPQTFTAWIAGVMVAVHFAGIIVGPYLLGLFGEAWWLAIVINLLGFTIIVGLHVHHLVRRSSTAESQDAS